MAATSDVIAHVHVTWEPPLAGAPSGYVVRRDGFEIAKIDASIRAFDDVSAEPGKIGAPVDLVATQGTRTDGVALTWAVQDQPKKSHAYEVVAVYDVLLSAPAGPALGARRPPPTSSYELSRDNGVTWHAAGSSTTYLDVEAPLGSISAGTATTQTDYPRSIVHLEVTGMPTSIAPPALSYRVRGLDNATPTVPSPSASGFRGVSRPSFQWQRSVADADGAFADAPGVTGSIWFDEAAPIDGAGRYYRASMTAAGAAPATTSAARGVRWGFKQVVPQYKNVCALRLDGALVCWGENAPASSPSGVFARLSRANSYSYTTSNCLLSTAGDLTCFGGSPPALTGPFKRVALGNQSATMCGIDLADHVQCTMTSADPARPTNAETFREIAAGDDLVCGIRTDGKLRCWGGLVGRDGDALPAGPSVDSYLALAVPGAYSKNVCAIREDHKLVCLGEDANGGVPLGISATGYVAVATVGFRTCALRESDGKMECWGVAYSPVPPSPSAESFVDVSLWGSSIAGLRADGSAVSWEEERRVNDRPNVDRFTQVAIGDFSCGLRPSGEVACWGNHAPSTAWAGSSVRRVAIVQGAVCVLRLDGSLACADDAGTRPTPAGTFEQIAGARYHGCALRTDHKVLCWGNNSDGQAPAGPSLDTFKSIDVGAMNTCAVRTDDMVVCSGASALNPPTSAFLDVSVNYGYACGRRLDKTVVCWGNINLSTAAAYERVFAGNGDVLALDANGMLERIGGYRGTPGVPWPDAFDDVAFSQTETDGCALRRDGHLLCWGQPGSPVP